MTQERILEIQKEAKRTAKFALPDIFDGRYKDDEIEVFLKARAKTNNIYQTV